MNDEENIGLFNERIAEFILKNEDFCNNSKNESNLVEIESNTSPRFNINHMSFSEDNEIIRTEEKE